MAKYTTRHNGVIIYRAWLALSPDGEMKMSRSEPGLPANWRAMKISVAVPESIFTTPQLSADITLPESVGQPDTIHADVLGMAEAMLKQSLGCEVRLHLANGDEA